MNQTKQRPTGPETNDDPVLDSVDMIEGSLDAVGLRVAVIITEWNESIINGLLDGALQTLHDCGVATADIDVIRVPGAFELPLAAKVAAASGKYDALIALGAVIRGGTPHFEYVCRACTDGIREVSLEFSLPVAFGVLTTDNEQQAADRAAPGEENKGREAALAAVRLHNTLKLLGTDQS
ncbi:MAG: 6,7-dimethyl-8-ribityllumazine synthase [Salinisphaeraceae bacterium]|nr:6,7-dimethyl-8-ribityllumazine synthase [Salinisphaeraceae bacterium]